MKRIVVLITGCLLSINLIAQTNVLDEYVKLGLESNLAIKQNQMALESAQLALKAAKGLFYPEVSLQSRYTMARGGRTIDFPIGDLMNPVYSTLNSMLEAQGGTAQFPMVENQKINFLREKEYEAKVSITQPIYYPTLNINKNIQQEQLSMSQAELNQYKRELTFQIKESFYNYLKAIQYYDLVEKTKELVNENHRVSEKLFQNNMITQDAVLRAKSEISKVQLLESDANKTKAMAKSYFNFLLNRDLDDSINVGSPNGNLSIVNLDELTQNAIENREELQLINHKVNIIDNAAKLSKVDMMPSLFFAFDYGIQDEKFNLSNNSDFIMGSVVLRWTLFKGNVNQNKYKQALIEKEKAQLFKQEVSNRIKLEVKQNNFEVDQQRQNLNLAQTRSNESAVVYRIVEKRYRLGEASLIELLDARNNMTEAEVSVIVTKYDFLTSIARLEMSSTTTLSQ